MDTGLADGKVRLYSEGRFIGVAELLERRLSPERLVSSVAKQAASAE
jgi:hypothetical protein